MNSKLMLFGVLMCCVLISRPPAPPCSCKCSCGGAPSALPTPPRAPACFEAMLPPAPAPAAVAISRPPGVPADPLSISMALTARKSFDVPEAKLSYGPVSTPLNGVNVQKVYFNNIPEEKLYGLNAAIIEVKKKFPAPTKAELLADLIEEAEEEAATAGAPAPAPYLSYADIGYGPALYKKPLFMRLGGQPALAAVAYGPKPLVGGCGYVPGKVAPAPEYLEQPLGYEAPCL